MGSRVRVAFGIAFLVTQGARASQPALSLTLRVYDYADVPAKALDEARAQVRRIFNKAGVAPLWLDCAAEEPRDRGCVQKLQPAQLIVRIVPKTNTSRTGHLLGAALVTPEGFSHYATIFYGEIRIRGHREEDFEGRMLGYAIAHEAGHLLIGAQLHPSAGIMTSGLITHQLRSMAKQFFLFTGSEAEQIRTNLRARIAATETPSAATVSLVE